MSQSVVVDNSALVLALTDFGASGAAMRARLHDVDSINAPDLLEYELLSAVFGMRRGGKLTEIEAEKALTAYALINIVSHRTFSFWRRARELYDNVSAYDAQYIVLAEALGLPLITCDARMARSGAAKCFIEVFD